MHFHDGLPFFVLIPTFLNAIISVSVIVSDAYAITDIDPMIPLKMANADINIWYQCISSILQHH